jgi:hypothetical protein
MGNDMNLWWQQEERRLLREELTAAKARVAKLEDALQDIRNRAAGSPGRDAEEIYDWACEALKDEP